MKTDGSGERLLASSFLDEGPTWAPNGRVLMFFRQNAGAGGPQLYSIDLTGYNEQLVQTQGFASDPAWSPDRSKIAFVSSRFGHADILIMTSDGTLVAAVTNDIPVDGDPVWSPDGTKIAFTRFKAPSQSEIYVANADGSNLTPVAFGPRSESEPAWSPDGKQIAFTRDIGGSTEIFVITLADGTETKLTSNEFIDSSPAWSPDGSRLAFVSNRDGQMHIYTMKIDGTERRRISNGQGRTTCSHYMPDGKSIVYASTHEEAPACPPSPDRSRGYVWAVYPGYDLYLAKDTGELVRKLTTEAGYDAEATVNWKTRKVIYTSLASGDLDLWTMNLDGSARRQITRTLGYDGGAVLSRDGKKVVWRANHPVAPDAVSLYKKLLGENLTAPMKMELFLKDIRLMLEAGQALHVPLPLTGMMQQLYTAAVAGGQGREDLSGIIRLYEAMAGLPRRGARGGA